MLVISFAVTAVAQERPVTLANTEYREFTSKEVWVAVHTKKDAGRLGNRILREAGVE